jgi:hypothetical protein
MHLQFPHEICWLLGADEEKLGDSHAEPVVLGFDMEGLSTEPVMIIQLCRRDGRCVVFHLPSLIANYGRGEALLLSRAHI